ALAAGGACRRRRGGGEPAPRAPRRRRRGRGRRTGAALRLSSAEVAARDADVARARIAGLLGPRMADMVAAAGVDGKAPRPQLSQAMREIEELFRHDVNDDALALDAAGAGDEGGAEHDAAEALEDPRPDDEIGGPRLVLDRHEDDAARGVGTLTDENEPGDVDSAIDWNMREVGG